VEASEAQRDKAPKRQHELAAQCEEQGRESRVQDDKIKDLQDEIRGLKQNMWQADTYLSIVDSLSVSHAEDEEDSNHDQSYRGDLPDDRINDNMNDQKEALVSSRRKWLAI
jgi:hypothetical protein